MSKITPGDIQTLEQVTEMVFRAIKTHDAIPDRDRHQANETYWPEVSTKWQYLDENDLRETKRRFQPTPWDLDHWLEIFEWIRDSEQFCELKLLRARAYGFSYRNIAIQRGRSDEYWRRRARRSLKKIHTQALSVARIDPIYRNVFKGEVK